MVQAPFPGFPEDIALVGECFVCKASLYSGLLPPTFKQHQDRKVCTNCWEAYRVDVLVVTVELLEEEVNQLRRQLAVQQKVAGASLTVMRSLADFLKKGEQ